MTLTEQIKRFAKDSLDLVNNSGMHPSICKLVLLDLIRDIEKFEEAQKTENNTDIAREEEKGK